MSKLNYISDSKTAYSVVDLYTTADDVDKEGTGQKVYYNGTGSTITAGAVVDVDVTDTGVDSTGKTITGRSIRPNATLNSPTYAGVVTEDIPTLSWGIVQMYGPIVANIDGTPAAGTAVVPSATSGTFEAVAAAINHRVGYTRTAVATGQATVFLQFG